MRPPPRRRRPRRRSAGPADRRSPSPDGSTPGGPGRPSLLAGDAIDDAGREHRMAEASVVNRGAGGPVDRRLLRQAGAARGYLAVAAGLGLAGAALILLQADLLSRALAEAARGTGAAALAAVLGWLAVVLAGRAVTAAGGEAAALHAAAVVKSGLRRRLSTHVLRLGPYWLSGQQAGEITT